MLSQPSIPLPRGWSKHVKSGLLHAISLAAMALTVARSRIVAGRCDLQAELDRANAEIALLKEELRIKDDRWSRLPWWVGIVVDHVSRAVVGFAIFRPRFGAVGKYGSVAVVERFIRSMKNEYTRHILIPLRLDAMRCELSPESVSGPGPRPSLALRGRLEPFPFELPR